MSLSHVPKNLAHLAHNNITHLAHNLTRLRRDSLLLASLALVISRILVANVSAVKAAGTPDGPQRYKEAIRTDMREIMGWTFGFVVLRQFQNYIAWGLREWYGIRDGSADPFLARKIKGWTGRAVNHPPASDGFWKTLGNLFKADGIPKLDLLDETKLMLKGESFALSNVATHLAHQETTHNVFKTLGMASTLSTGKLLQRLYKWVPLVGGSVPAVFLAGYALERYTRDHADQTVDQVSKTLKAFRASLPFKNNANTTGPATAFSALPPAFNRQSIAPTSVPNHFAEAIPPTMNSVISPTLYRFAGPSGYSTPWTRPF